MAHATPPDQRGRVGGWFQAGNLGGTGLGGGAGLWMATNLPSTEQAQPWISGAALGVGFLLCCIALPLVPDAAAEARTTSLPKAMAGVVGEMWTMIRTRAGLLCTALCLLPMNSGTATNVLAQAEVASKWGADENTVAMVNGVLNGAVSAAGCLIAGEICARVNSRLVYAGVAILLAMVSVGMALAPMTREMYITFSLVYVFVVGLSYTAFTGFVLDVIGKGAAATKYNAFASLSNAPITYMGLVLAWAQTRWGERGMLLTDAGANVVGLGLLGLVGLVIGMLVPATIRSGCSVCGYDIAGLPRGSLCPECGHSAVEADTTLT
ncbi:MAG: MFS transporter [Phycisphaerales bacterium]